MSFLLTRVLSQKQQGYNYHFDILNIKDVGLDISGYGHLYFNSSLSYDALCMLFMRWDIIVCAVFQKSVKMNDSSIRETLIFTIYKDISSNRTAFLTIIFILYMTSVVVNTSLMLLVYLDTSLHKPMYFFLFCLILNGLIGSTAIWPHVMFLLLTEVNTTSYLGCLIQFFSTGELWWLQLHSANCDGIWQASIHISASAISYYHDPTKSEMAPDNG